MANKSNKEPFNYNYLSAAFIYLWAFAFLIGTSEIKDPHSRMFPTVISVLSIVIATLIILRNRFNWGKKEEPLDFSGTSMALVMFALLLAYAVAIAFVGFYLATPFYMYVTMSVLGQKNKRAMIAVCLLFPAGVYLFFDMLLKMAIPVGRLFS